MLSGMFVAEGRGQEVDGTSEERTAGREAAGPNSRREEKLCLFATATSYDMRRIPEMGLLEWMRPVKRSVVISSASDSCRFDAGRWAAGSGGVYRSGERRISSALSIARLTECGQFSCASVRMWITFTIGGSNFSGMTSCSLCLSSDPSSSSSSSRRLRLNQENKWHTSEGTVRPADSKQRRLRLRVGVFVAVSRTSSPDSVSAVADVLSPDTTRPAFPFARCTAL